MLSRYLRKDGSYWYEADYKEIDKSEVVRLLSEFGINPDNLLIIMHQGMIEELGAISTQQRLTMVEEAVGFREYRERIFQSESDLKSMVSEEGSLIQLIDNANQTIEYWKQIYDRYLEKKKLQEHRALLERELLWAQEGKLSQVAIQSVKERLEDEAGVPRRPHRPAEEVWGASRRRCTEPSARGRSSSGSSTGRWSGRRGSGPDDEGARDAMKRLRTELETIREDLRAISGPGADPKKLKRIQEFLDFSSQSSKSDSEEAGRKKIELDREVASLQAELGGVEDLDKKDDRRVHLATSEVRGPRVPDQGHRVGDQGAGAVREGGQWASSRR